MSDDNDRYLAIWAKAIDTQMHFNEMSAKSRQLGLTFVAAALGVAVVLLSRGDDFALFVSVLGHEVQLHIAVFLLIAAALALIAVRGLDLGVYHRMLRGAVTFGEDFEQNYMKKLFDLNKGMTQAISHYSRHDDAGVKIENGRYTYEGGSRKSAEAKIKKFYRYTMAFLWITALLLLVLTNVSSWRSASAETDNVARETPPAVRTAPTIER